MENRASLMEIGLFHREVKTRKDTQLPIMNLDFAYIALRNTYKRSSQYLILGTKSSSYWTHYLKGCLNLAVVTSGKLGLTMRFYQENSAQIDK